MAVFSDLEVQPSGIHALGVFARRSFVVGEVVLTWDTSVEIPRDAVASLPPAERVYVHPFGEHTLIRIMSPERFVNHSCEHNTVVENFRDVAVRRIEVGDEITSDYGSDGSDVSFDCACGTAACRGRIGTAARDLNNPETGGGEPCPPCSES